MTKSALAAVFALSLPVLYGSYSDYMSAKRKFESIEADRLKPGSQVALTPKELNAYAEREVAEAVPEGVRNPKVELGAGVATASALVDFAKIRRAQGNPPGWLMSRLLEGERPVRVTARIQSSDGKATVDIQRVEISGTLIEGSVLDYLIDNYVRSRYPDAKIGEPFELGHRIEKLDVKPTAVHVLIGR